MNSAELRTKISTWNLSQSEFARWLEVSPGAVTQWLAEARGIPGPVAAFIKLFESLPPSLQAIHLSLVKKGNMNMDGMYFVEFIGSTGSNGATLTLKDGIVYGFDLTGGIYDGFYRPGALGMMEVQIVVKIPAGAASVIRNISQPFDWSLIAQASIPTNVASAEVLVATNMGEVIKAKFSRMRDLPLAA